DRRKGGGHGAGARHFLTKRAPGSSDAEVNRQRGHSTKIQREITGTMITRHPARTNWSRRDVLRGSAAALMGAYGLAPRYGLAADIPMEYDGSKFQMAAPEPNPKRGGVMRYGLLNRPPPFDVHQPVTAGNIGTQGS